MSGRHEPEQRTLTWRTPLRFFLRYGLPFVGAFLILHYMVASIGGNINRIGFTVGVLLIVATYTARLVPGR